MVSVNRWFPIILDYTSTLKFKGNEDIMKSKQLAESTYQWYCEHKRDLPWRHTRDPYKIWVSEVMSQQTQLERVVPYYERFIHRLPTIADLAVIQEDELLKLWEGLGYYSRVRNMQKAARYIQDEKDGVFPTTYDEIVQLSGVGPYIAGAIAGICFNERVSAVDGNVIRLFSRVYEIQDDVRQAKTIKTIQQKAQKAVATGVVGDINQGFIELGALICTPKNPKCLICPLQAICTCFENQTVGAFPYKSPAKRQKEYQLVACIVEDKHGNIYVEQREMELLHHQWQFPSFDQSVAIDTIADEISVKLDGTVQARLCEGERVRHIFSHQIWDIESRYFYIDRLFEAGEYLTESTHLITAHRKIYKR